VQILKADNEKWKSKSNGAIQLKFENDKLKKKVSVLENTISRIMEFLERLNLREKLELFLKQTERVKTKSLSNNKDFQF
jgi:hypothetical protein